MEYKISKPGQVIVINGELYQFLKESTEHRNNRRELHIEEKFYTCENCDLEDCPVKLLIVDKDRFKITAADSIDTLFKKSYCYKYITVKDFYKSYACTFKKLSGGV